MYKYYSYIKISMIYIYCIDNKRHEAKAIQYDHHF